MRQKPTSAGKLEFLALSKGFVMRKVINLFRVKWRVVILF